MPAPRIDWPCIDAATRRDATARVDFSIAGRVVGSVARAHLAPLREFPALLAVGQDSVDLRVDAEKRSVALATVNLALRDQGRIRAWRDEIFPVFDLGTMQPLARIERAASRFWGTLTLGAHGTGFVADRAGRPARIWIAQRSLGKATDPGLFDNLVGGGVPAGQTPHQALLREGWEEAGLPVEVMQRARPGRVIRLRRDIPEGLLHEWLYSWDLALEADELPSNQDGEVAGFSLLPVPEAAALAAGGTMTVDASLVTLDFLLRHELLAAGAQLDLAAAMAGLWVQDAR